jgi:RHS repeat-associated protein
LDRNPLGSLAWPFEIVSTAPRPLESVQDATLPRVSAAQFLLSDGWTSRRLAGVLRFCAAIVAILLVLVLIAPVAESNFRTDSPPLNGAKSIDLPVSESAPLPPNSTDSPGGPSPEPGTVTSAFVPPQPISSALPLDVVASVLNETASEYVYTTVAGSYTFSKDKPYLMKYETVEGDVLVKASTFVVLSPGISLFTSADVLNATDSLYEVRYDFILGVASGNVTITYDFRDDGPPKIAAERQGQLTLPLIWVTQTVDTVAFNDSSTVDFASLTEPVDVTPADLSLTIGPDKDPLNWSRRLSLDWSDAGAGTAFVGPFSAGSITGPAVFVIFPVNLAAVDPIAAGGSTSSAATDYSIQRKTFFTGDRFWAFWYDGSGIAYASSQLSYANGQNTLTPWTAKMTAPSGSLPSGIDYRGFDVDQRGGTVLVGYIAAGLTSMKVLVGSITGSFITWFGPYIVASWSTAEAGIPSVVIGSDAYFWAAFVWKSGGTTFVDRYRSNDQGSASFSLSASDPLAGAPADSAVRLVPLSNGSLVSISSTKGYSTISTRRFGPGGWGSSQNRDVKLPTLDSRGGIFSAIAMKDDKVYIVFKGDNANAPGLRFVVLLTDDSLSPAPPNPPGTVDSTSNPNQPTLAIDANGDLHVFWLFVDAPSGSFRWHIRYSRQLPDGGSWITYSEPWSYVGQQRMGLTASVVAANQLSLLWTEGDFSPYNVIFGAVEAPMDLGGQTGQPWNRQGLSPYQSYFQQLSEFVSPGSGLLTIRQTDLTIPGRKLNLEIARVLVTPRAFVLGTPSPYLFEDYPAANLGKGWSFDFPWISSQYLHLPGGQMYVLKWQSDRFENHDGEHFVLTRTCSPSCFYYTLNSKSGIRYDFNPSKQLTGIRDPSGNTISFTYTSGRINRITDTVGRIVLFAYNPDGTVASIASGSQTVSYTYSTSGLTVLKSVSDSLGRKTQFDYTDTRNAYLVTTITYPTGAKSAYSWSNPAVTVGSDLQAYYVTLQDTLNATGQSIRSNQFDYTVVNGKVTYSKITTYDAGVAKGSTVQMYDVAGSKSTTIRRDAAGVQLDRQVTRFGGGAVGQVDFYPGTAMTPSYSTYAAYDDWGNPIYSRDAVGHERFASYVNTRNQGGFFAPGRLTRTWSGYVFYNDFEGRDLSDWTLDTSAGTVGLDYETFESSPPALKVANTGGPTGVAAATHTFPAETDYFVAEAVVRTTETNKHHFVLLRSSAGGLRVYASLSYNGYLAWSTDGVTWNDILAAPYKAGQWVRLGFEVDLLAGTYDIWFNGQEVKAGAALVGGTGGNVDRFNFQASYSGGGAATMYVDMAEAYTGSAVTVGGLQNGQFVMFEDAQGRTLKALKAVGTSVIWWTTPGVLPYVRLEVLDPDGFRIYSGPVYELWGGDSWTFTQPWKALPARSQSGFLRYSALYVDDSYPTGAVPVNAEDSWDWGPYDFPPAGTSSHRSKYLTGTHQHYFLDATSTLAMSSGQFHIQYVYIPVGQYPSEIMLQFRDTANSWEHRAYWGSNLIPWGTDGTSSRRSMGGLPTQAGRWLMLIAKADDVGTPGLSVEGLGYTLYGGRATWDFSARGDAQTGQIQIAGLQQYWSASVYDSTGTFIGSGTVPTSGSVAAVDVYGASNKIRAFPFEGYFVVRNEYSIDVYRSPILPFWGGDKYTYQATDFYPNTNVDPTIHDRPACMLEYQTGRGASPEVPLKSCSRYTSQGLMDLSETWDVSTWRQTAYTYDNYGQVAIVLDPKGNNVFYDHSATYSGAYVTRVRDGVGTIARASYDSSTGWPLATMDGRGYITRYSYDSLSRGTEESRFDLPPASEVLYLDMDWTTEEATPRLEDLSGRGNHGTISGPIAVPGKVGVARSFDGVDDVVTVPASSSLNSASFTAALWFNRDTFTTSQGLIGKASFPNSWRIWTRTDGKIEADAKNDAIGNLVSQTTVVAGRWYHVGLTFDGTTARLYVNGVQEASAATGDWGGAYNVAVWVGDTDSTSPFDGTIDEVRIFNTALNETNIRALFTNAYGRLSSSSIVYDDAGNAVTSYGPTTMPRLIHYDLESVLNGKVEDLGGRGNHASNNGAAASQTTCKYGGCYYFDGGDWMEAADASSQRPGRISVTAWFRADDLNANHVIVAKKEKSSPSTLGFALWTGVDGKMYFSVYDSTRGEHRASSTSAISAATYYHVVGISDGATVSLYLNGALQSPSASFLGDVAYTADPLTIGAQYNLGLKDGYFRGYIDEVQVFDRGLTSAEVTALFQGTEKGFYAKRYFDSLGRATRSVREDLFGTLRSWQSLAYNFRDQVISSTLARNSTATFTTSYAYDFFGRPTLVSYPGFGNYPVTVTYDGVNRIRTVVAENGRKVQYFYDPGGRMTAAREYYDPSNYYTTSYVYDEVGNLLSVTNALNQVTQHAYDNQNRLTKTTYADTTKYETYTYDEVGNLKTKTDRAGQLTTNGYDVRYRLTTIDYGGTTPNPDVGYAYDLNDNPTTVTNYAANPATTVAYVYDGMDRATTETDTISGATYGVGYAYDPAGRLTQLTYPDNTAVSYLYDSLGRTSKVKDASTTYGSFAYSADDLTNNVTLGNGITQTYGYNGRGWPTSIKATYGQTTYLDLGYAYDNSGNVLTMGQATDTYDKLDRLITASGGFGTQAFTYDAVGNRLRLDGNMTTVILRPNGAGSSTQWSPTGCTQNWDCVDDATSDGEATRVESGVPGTVDAYNVQDLGQTSKTITSVTVTAVARHHSVACNIEPQSCYAVIALQVNGYSGSSQGLTPVYQSYSQTWTTNPATGQPWTVSEVNALQAGINLVDVGQSARVTQLYASVATADRTTYVYSNGATGMNQLTSLSTNGGAATTYGYDATGNLLSKFGATKTCYAWNPENLLTRVKTVPSACADIGTQVQAYTYDGLGRRAKVDGTSGAAWTVSIVAGMDTIYEKDNAGAVTRYIFANGLRIARIECTAANPPVCTTKYYLADHLGSTRKVLKADRTEAFSTDYEPFGKPSAPSGTEAYKFTSEKHDNPTGLVYLRARQYDPDVGRFVSADPVLGSLSTPQTQNRYVYVANNPVRFSDPSGEVMMHAGSWPIAGGPCAWNWDIWIQCVGSAWSSYSSAVDAANGREFNCLRLSVSNLGCDSESLHATQDVLTKGFGLVSTVLAPLDSLPINPIDAPVPGTLPVRGPGFTPDPEPGAGWTVPSDSFGNPVRNPYEAAVMEQRLKLGGGIVEHEPLGQMGPDFSVIGGRYGGPKGAYYEATEWAHAEKWRQLQKLENLRLQGYQVGFFYGRADDAFLRAANEFPNVRLIPFWTR